MCLCVAPMQSWYAAGGYKGPRPPKQRVKAAIPDLGTMADKEVANLCSRFFEWYVVDDRPGDPTYNKRSSKVRNKPCLGHILLKRACMTLQQQWCIGAQCCRRLSSF
jgi:hypothetical protein